MPPGESTAQEHTRCHSVHMNLIEVAKILKIVCSALVRRHHYQTTRYDTSAYARMCSPAKSWTFKKLTVSSVTRHELLYVTREDGATTVFAIKY